MSRLLNSTIQPIAYIELIKDGAYCYFEKMRLTQEDKDFINDIHCMNWIKIPTGYYNRWYLLVSFGNYDIEMNLEFLIGMIRKYTNDIRIRYNDDEKYKKLIF